MPHQESNKMYGIKQIKEICMELRSLGCPVWKIARLLSISEAKVVQLSGIGGNL